MRTALTQLCFFQTTGVSLTRLHIKKNQSYAADKQLVKRQTAQPHTA